MSSAIPCYIPPCKVDHDPRGNVANGSNTMKEGGTDPKSLHEIGLADTEATGCVGNRECRCGHEGNLYGLEMADSNVAWTRYPPTSSRHSPGGCYHMDEEISPSSKLCHCQERTKCGYDLAPIWETHVPVNNLVSRVIVRAIPHLLLDFG